MHLGCGPLAVHLALAARSLLLPSQDVASLSSSQPSSLSPETLRCTSNARPGSRSPHLAPAPQRAASGLFPCPYPGNQSLRSPRLVTVPQILWCNLLAAWICTTSRSASLIGLPVAPQCCLPLTWHAVQSSFSSGSGHILDLRRSPFVS